MANFRKHLETGAKAGTFVGCIFYIIQYIKAKNRNPLYVFNFGEFLKTMLIGTGLGAISGILPDKMEPATNPNHRGFFHSYLFWFTAGFVTLIILLGKFKTIWKFIASCLFAGYSSHLVLDSKSTKSLPIHGIYS